MRRRQFVSLVGAAALPAAALPVSAKPPDLVDADKLLDREALHKMADRLAVSSAGNIHAVLVARGGKLLFERYFSGPDEVSNRRVRNIAFDADTMHDVKSVTKSVASLALGIAIDRGLIRSVDEPIFSFFPELADLRSPEKDRLRLVHALTMSMSLWASPPCSGRGSGATAMPEADCACGRVTWRRLASSSSRAAAGTAARSCRRAGSTPR